MRAYTLSVLSKLASSGDPITEKEIILWVNAKLANAEKTTSIRSFQDGSIANGRGKYPSPPTFMFCKQNFNPNLKFAQSFVT